MTLDQTPDRFSLRTAEETAADPAVKRLVFDLLARGADGNKIRRALRRADYHPGAWRIIRAEWEDDLDVSEVISTNVRRIYRLRLSA